MLGSCDKKNYLARVPYPQEHNQEGNWWLGWVLPQVKAGHDSEPYHTGAHTTIQGSLRKPLCFLPLLLPSDGKTAQAHNGSWGPSICVSGPTLLLKERHPCSGMPHLLSKLSAGTGQQGRARGFSEAVSLTVVFTSS